MSSAQSDPLVEHWRFVATTPPERAENERYVEALRTIRAVCKERAEAWARKYRRDGEADDLAGGAYLIVTRRIRESATGEGNPLRQDSVGAIKKYVWSCVGTVARRRSTDRGIEDSFKDLVPPPPEALVRAELNSILDAFFSKIVRDHQTWSDVMRFGVQRYLGQTTLEEYLRRSRGEKYGEDPDRDRDWLDTRLRRARNALHIRIDGVTALDPETRLAFHGLVDAVLFLRGRAPSGEDHDD